MAAQQLSADQLKAELRAVGERRAGIEQAVAQRMARLEAAGVGMTGSLVDREGYPRADIDIPAIRADRHQVIALTNDQKALTSQMEQLLHALHAQSRQPGAPATPPAAAPAAPSASPPGPAAQQQQQQAPLQAVQQQLRPFAVVDEVSHDSPASSAGINLGDQLCRFGPVVADTPNTLQQVAATLQAHEGREVEAVLLRHGAPITLRLVPQQWGGRGLLGCHLRPL